MKRDHAQVLAGGVPDVFAEPDHSKRIGYSEAARPGRGEGGHLEPERVEAVRGPVSIDATRVHLTMPGVVSFLISRSFGPSSVRTGSLKDQRTPQNAEITHRSNLVFTSFTMGLFCCVVAEFSC